MLCDISLLQSPGINLQVTVMDKDPNNDDDLVEELTKKIRISPAATKSAARWQSETLSGRTT